MRNANANPARNLAARERSSDSANRAQPDSKSGRITNASEALSMSLRTQALANVTLSEVTPRGEMAHVRYIASVQEFAFHETE